MCLPLSGSRRFAPSPTGWGIAAPFEHPLFYAFIGSIAFAIFSAIVFRSIPERLIWCATLLLSALFIWYGWFSQGAPFVLHELHTFDPVEAAKEIRSFRNGSLIGTATLLGCFVCLPVFHQFVGRLKSGQ